MVDGSAGVAGTETIAEGDFCTAIVSKGFKMMYVDSTSTYEMYSLRDGFRKVTPQQYPFGYDLQAKLDEYLRSAAERRRTAAVDADEEAVRQLKALGYL